ncbi:hypothetical protein LSH36_1768g00015 [Paralvinella palmiformis]|uniref:Uncharacterized protein n=1 Tax=Paralvinella palmiformis TaxID=53620 RepID=A0AAD9IRZ8_9ANNE|nr:hypothetical protein LSH36_1768g00015 [Paralvinella palmiformis]
MRDSLYTVLNMAIHWAVQYERYQRFATEEFLLREGGVMCPAPGCGEGIVPEDTRRIQCVRPECQRYPQFENPDSPDGF